MERRSFFTKMLTGVGAASAIAQASPAQTADSIQPAAASGLPIYMVDETRVDHQTIYSSALLPPGTYIFYYPSPNDHFPPIMKVADHNEAERLEVSLAGVSTAAHGGTSPEVVAKPTDWAWHPAYQDTLDLRRKYDAATNLIANQTTKGFQCVLYPCGCSASGWVILDSQQTTIPLYCSEHGDHEHLNGYLICGARPFIDVNQDFTGPPTAI